MIRKTIFKTLCWTNGMLNDGKKNKVTLLLVNFLLLCSHAHSQFHSPTINAFLGTNEYAAGNANNYVTGASTWYLTWNNTDLFIYLQNANQAEPVTIYLDIDPIAPVNGGTNANGTLVGLDYDGYTIRPNLPFRADVAIYCHSGYRELFRKNGSGGWTSLGGGNLGFLGVVYWEVLTAGTVLLLSIGWVMFHIITECMHKFPSRIITVIM
jgi:hypothetical protein